MGRPKKLLKEILDEIVSVIFEKSNILE